MSEANEQVLVIKKEKIERFLPWFYQGFWSANEQSNFFNQLINVLLDEREAFFMDRAEAEVNPNFKQLIPYCLIESNSEKDLYCIYQRTKKSGEKRLQSKWSIAAGGHLNPCDNNGNMYYDGVKRELQEELGLDLEINKKTAPILGMIYDESNDVGKVHLGICHKIIVDKSAVLRYNDDAISNMQFLTPEEFGDREFENWSKIIIKELL